MQAPVPFVLDHLGVMSFAYAHPRAMMLADRGASDYCGARCCLLNGVFSGLELGAQAVEKHLKAMLAFKDPNENPRKFEHNLLPFAQQVESRGIALLSPHFKTLERLQAHYQARYPDNPGQPSTASTAELVEVDVLMNHLLESMPIPREVSLRSGVFARAIGSAKSQVISAEEYWLVRENPILQAKIPQLTEEVLAWFASAHPPATNPPSSGHAKGSFAPLSPPLVSNVSVP